MREVMELRLKLTGVLPFILRVRPNAVPSRRPIFQTGVAYFRIRPRRSATGTRPGKVGRLGDRRVLRAFNLPLYPCANVSESARRMRRDLLTRSGDAVHVASGGEGRRFRRASRWVARNLHGVVYRLSVRATCITASARSRGVPK